MSWLKAILSASALPAFICFMSPAMAGDDSVPMELQPGMTKILTVPRPFQAMVMGNQNVANASAINLKSIAITGKGTGLTNLVIFDSEGKEISTTTIQVVQAAYFSEHAVPRREVRVIVFDSKRRRPDLDRRYLCGQNCSEIDVDEPVALNPPGNTSAAVGTTTSRTLTSVTPTAPTGPGGPAVPVGHVAPVAPSGQY